MNLVDTSVWILFFSAKQPLDLTRWTMFDDIATCLPVIQEVLQGFRDENAFRLAREAMTHFPTVENPLSSELFEEAIDLYRLARKKGYTVRSSIDCIIAVAAMRNDLTLLHHDRDFIHLAAISNLKQIDVRVA